MAPSFFTVGVIRLRSLCVRNKWFNHLNHLPEIQMAPSLYDVCPNWTDFGCGCVFSCPGVLILTARSRLAGRTDGTYQGS